MHFFVVIWAIAATEPVEMSFDLQADGSVAVDTSIGDLLSVEVEVESENSAAYVSEAVPAGPSGYVTGALVSDLSGWTQLHITTTHVLAGVVIEVATDRYFFCGSDVCSERTSTEWGVATGEFRLILTGDGTQIVDAPLVATDEKRTR